MLGIFIVSLALLFGKSITFSLLFFLSSIQRLPLSQAVVLNFTTPVMASIMARIVLRENLKISDIGGTVVFFFPFYLES